MAEEKKMPATEAMVKLLDKLVEETVETKKLVESTIPEGIIEPLALITVTTTPTIVHPPHLDKHWFSMSIVNDGDVACWIIVNTGKSSDRPYQLYPEEVYEVDMRSAKIRDVYAWTDSGTTILRIKGLR